MQISACTNKVASKQGVHTYIHHHTLQCAFVCFSNCYVYPPPPPPPALSPHTQSQQAVGLSRRKTSKGKKPCFSVGTALTSLGKQEVSEVTS